MKKVPEHISFPEAAERISARYDASTDALLLVMLGQEYVVHHSGVTLHGQKAPDAHETVIVEYLSAPGTAFAELPWRSLGDFAGAASNNVRKRVEEPLAQHASELIARSTILLPHIGATLTPSLIGSDLAITVRALPKVSLHAELSPESQDFPPQVWVLFSQNADQFLGWEHLQVLAELFKDRLLSLLRIY